MKKILEIKSSDWEKGLSFDQETFTNGIFKTFVNCDPFKRRGTFTPGDIIAEVSGTIDTNKVIRVLLPVCKSALASNIPQYYAWADDGKVYQSNTATVSDVSAQIIQGSAVIREAAIFKSQIIYATNTGVMANAIPLASGSDVFILGGLTAGPHPFVVGADKNGYMGNGNNIAKITSLTATVNNSTSVAVSLETGFVIKKLINDGRFLVIIADDASTAYSFSLKNRCVVAFWDMSASTLDQLFEFQDSYIAGAEIVGDIIKIITPSGIYETNVVSRAKLVVPFGFSKVINSTATPTDFHSVASYKQNFLMWGTNSSSGNSPVYNYGNTINGQINRLFQPYLVTGFPITALATDGNTVMAAVGATDSSNVKLYTLDFTPTETASFNLAGVSFDKPYSFHHARIVLREPMSANKNVTLRILSSAGTKTVKALETKSNTTDPGEKVLIFDHTSAGDGTDIKAFDEISDVLVTTNIAIQSLTIYGDEYDERGSYG